MSLVTCCAASLPLFPDQPCAAACSVPRQAPAPPRRPLKGPAAKLAQQLLALDPNLFFVRRMHSEATGSHQPADALGCRSPQSPKQTVSSSASLKRQSRTAELLVRAQLLVLHGCKQHAWCCRLSLWSMVAFWWLIGLLMHWLSSESVARSPYPAQHLESPADSWAPVSFSGRADWPGAQAKEDHQDKATGRAPWCPAGEEHRSGQQGVATAQRHCPVEHVWTH